MAAAAKAYGGGDRMRKENEWYEESEEKASVTV